MRISQSQQAAIQYVLDAGAEFGYGNMINHLQTAWAKSLMEKYGTRRASGTEPAIR